MQYILTILILLHITGNDYVYDVNGNLTQDKNKNFTIQYNHLNLPQRITFADNSKIDYTYTARGAKLSQAYLNASNAVISRTDFSGGFRYLNNTLVQVSHAEGHLAKQGSTFVYCYYLTDHLGNVRVVLNTQPGQGSMMMATMEDENTLHEQSQFIDYEKSMRVAGELFDHTGTHPGGGKALRLAGGQTKGLAASLSVMPGDTVKLQVFGKYLDMHNARGNEALQNIVTSILTAGTMPSATLEGTALATPVREGTLPFGAVLAKANETNGPKAYLNWLYFDTNFAMKGGGYKQLIVPIRVTRQRTLI